MDTPQQQQPQNLQPSLAELDAPPQQQPPQEPPKTEESKNPVTIPSPQDPPKTEDKKPEEQKDDKPPVDTPATEDQNDPVTPEDFWAEVAKLRGDDLQFEFPSEIEDILTPQGVHHAIKTAEERAIERWEQTLQQEDPRGYSYILHRSRGGDDETFFANKTEVLPDVETLKNSVDLQQAFYKRALTGRGISPEQADLLIKDAVDKNKLFGLVESEHKTIKDAQEDQLQKLLKLNEESNKREQQAINKMATNLQEYILQNKGLEITIPDARRGEFLQFVNSLMLLDRDSGRWFINQELTRENTAQVLSALYYMHVKGNMDDIITNRANQKNVQKVRLKMQGDKTPKNTAPDPNKRTNDKPGIQPALSEI